MTPTRLAAGVLVALSAAGLQGCCFDACSANAGADIDAGIDAEPNPGAHAAPARRLRIVDWGPREGRAGVPFNMQPGGRAALWIRLDRAIDGRTALVQFDDAYLEAQVAGNLVTAAVPGQSYASPGVYAVRVVASGGNGDAARWSSDRVWFTVRQPPAPRSAAAAPRSPSRRHRPAP